ncbi:MAG TPA: hypothetical protein VNT60_04730 [Deinococcales bacterium]|nr:hypothetical protein [Deinococcales bacterium]
MTPFAITTLETSTSLDICRGFALVPSLGTVRASVQGSNVQREIARFDNFVIIATRFNLRVRGGYFIGICGPAYAFSANITGSEDGTTCRINWSGKYGVYGDLDAVGAGVQMGLQFIFNFAISVEQNFPYLSCPSTWTCTWVDNWVRLLNEAMDIVVDPIAIAFNFIVGTAGQKALNAEKPKIPAQSPTGPLGINLYKTEYGALKSRGEANLMPSVLIPINLLDLLVFIPVVGKVITALQKVGGGLQVGPVIGVSFPVRVFPTRVWINTRGYQLVARDSNGTTIIGTRSWDAWWHPNEAVVELSHTATMDMRVGVFFNIWVLKIFGFGQNFTVGIGEAITAFGGNWHVPQTHVNYIAQNLGVTTGVAASACGCGPSQTAEAAPAAPKPRVVFHKPAPAAAS